MAKKYFKIVPIKHLLKNNRTAKSGEVIEAGAFINLQDSLDRGFCKEVKAPKGAAAKNAKATAKATKKATKKAEKKAAKDLAKTDSKATESKDGKKDLSKLSAKELEDFAKSNSIELTSADKASKSKTIEAIEKSLAEQS